MKRVQLLRRSLIFHWRTNLAVVLGVAVGTAVLTGAMLVGDSMRGSLRETALRRIGPFTHALTAHRFFGESLADSLDLGRPTDSENLKKSTGGHVPGGTPVQSTGRQAALPIVDTGVVPLILLSGGATHAIERVHASGVTVLGVDQRFWSAIHADTRTSTDSWNAGRKVALNDALATALGAVVGDDVLLRIGKPMNISVETLLGRRDEVAETLRLTVSEIVAADRLGDFSLNPRQFRPRNAFVPLEVLQRALDQGGSVNTVLIAGGLPEPQYAGAVDDALPRRLAKAVTLGDLGLTLRRNEGQGYVSLESESMLIEPAVETAAITAAQTFGATASPVLTYLANTIANESRGGQAEGIPYSTVAAIDPTSPVWNRLRLEGGGESALQAGEIVLNRWAATDLQAAIGDRIGLTYYVTGAFGSLETHKESFTLRGIAAMEGAAVDSGFTPEYRGVTDTQDLSDWNPPFPMDLKRIRDKDEAYWDGYRAAPKAFVTLADGERMWSRNRERFGRYTSIRLYPGNGASVSASASDFEQELLRNINLPSIGFSFEDVRTRMLHASEGTQEFGMLFIGFSFFLLASAALLVALLFRLSVERRAGEIGLLLATGFTTRSVTRLFAVQGAILAGIGGVVGLAASVGYARLMLLGLRTLWSDAVNAAFLRLFATPRTLIIGAAAGFVIAMSSIVWSLRGLTGSSPHSLLSGMAAAGGKSGTEGGKWARIGLLIGGVSAVLAVLPPTSALISRPLAFFCGGAGTLVAGLAWFTLRLQREPGRPITRPGGTAVLRLGARNIRRNRRRSVLTAGLLAAASFLIVSLESFRFQTPSMSRDRRSGTGGFSLLAESATPLVFDLNTEAGRRAINLPANAADELAEATVVPFRLRPGDASSCRNLYRPGQPRIVGVGATMIERGGFVFGETMEASLNERANPWFLLGQRFDDEAIPVIGDEAAVRWQLHSGLGKDLIIADDHGRNMHLRFVALLKGSPLQDELLIAEEHFVRLFPRIDGHAFFLIDAPTDRAEAVGRFLERELEAFSFDADFTAARLAGYLAVQNTYISTFQLLGGFGLMLGTLGLAAVMLRNVWERRAELALFRAVGFSRLQLHLLVLCENMFLMMLGTGLGVGTALVAVTPHLGLQLQTGDFPWLSLGATLSAVIAMGFAAGFGAILPTLRAPLISALRSE